LSERELTPQQEEQVRRLLAEARHDDPIPADVADRLDRALVDLSRDEPDAAGRAGVIDLAARRRRRNAAALLAGAAAVIVAGFAVGQAVDVGGSSGDAGSANESVARDQSNNESSDESSGLAGSPEAGEDAGGGVAAAPPLQLSSKHLARDLTEQLPAAASGNITKDSAREALGSFGCATAPPAAYGPGTFFAAYYDGVPAVVALRPPTVRTQQADVLECETGTELRSVTLARE
jgi:hypothetical protein